METNQQSPEKSKVLIISPQQITKLGLMQHITSVMKSQTRPTTSSNNDEDKQLTTVETITPVSEVKNPPKPLETEPSTKRIARRPPKLKKRDIQILKQKITDKIRAQDSIESLKESTEEPSKMYVPCELLQADDEATEKQEVTVNLIKTKLKKKLGRGAHAKHLLKEAHTLRKEAVSPETETLDYGIEKVVSEGEPCTKSNKEGSENLKEKCSKINVLSNETISLSQTCINEMLKQNCPDGRSASDVDTNSDDANTKIDNNQVGEQNSNLEESSNTDQIHAENSNNVTTSGPNKDEAETETEKDSNIEISITAVIERCLREKSNRTEFDIAEQSNALFSNIERFTTAQPKIISDDSTSSSTSVKTSKKDRGQIRSNAELSGTNSTFVPDNVEHIDCANIKRRIKPKPKLVKKIKHSADSTISNITQDDESVNKDSENTVFCKMKEKSENVDNVQLSAHKRKTSKRKLSDSENFKIPDSSVMKATLTNRGSNVKDTKNKDSTALDSVVKMEVADSNNTSPKSAESSLAGVSKRSSRKRKILDYASLADGGKFEETTDKDVNSSSNEQSDVVKGKRGRRKKEKFNPDVETTSVDTPISSSEKINEANCEEKLEEVHADNSKITSSLEIVNSTVVQTPETKKKKGRPRGRYGSTNPQQTNMLNTVFQHINIANTSQATSDKLQMDPPHNDLNVRDDAESNSVTAENFTVCGVCNTQILKTLWTHHKYRNHNNLAWKQGDPPLDLNNQTLVMSILTNLYKRKKPLYCEYCGQVKKSVLGYLSHKSVCQKSVMEVDAMRIQCEYCEHSVLPVSMACHLKICKGLLVPCPEIDSYENLTNDQELPLSGKRKAANRAGNLLKEEVNDISESERKKCTWFINFDFHPTYFGKKRIQGEVHQKGVAACWFEKCKYETADVEEMATHIWKCVHKFTQGYTCKFCMVTCASENQIVEHSLHKHSKLVDDNPYCYEDNQMDTNDLVLISEDQDEKPNKNNKKSMSKGINFLLKHRYYPSSAPVRYPPAAEWSFEFCMQNFCMDNLFPNFRVTRDYYERLDPTMISKYLPQQKYSVCTASIESKVYTDPLKLDYDWKRYKLFETDALHNDTSTIFCGGSISAMAWVPTPYNVEGCEQILAVSTNSNFNKGHPVDLLYKECGVIQFWNCGTLKNNGAITENPKLEFCIVHDHGPIWYLEWCPSGCYDTDPQWDDLQRLGLLAVAAADSHVYIYSICSLESLGGKLFRTKPILELILDTVTEISVNGIQPHPTTISWSKAKEHHYIAVGYANGMVAVYNLQNPSSLLNCKVNNSKTPAMFPYQIFNAHYHAITTLHLYHLNDGRRWVMSGSLDRTIKYWDLENPTVPISNFTKFIVTDGVWLNHWISTVHTYDDCCGGGLTYTSIHQLRNFESECTSAMHSNSHVSSISGSEWTNGFIQGNVVGEIVGFFPHQLFYGLDGDKSLRKKKAILGYARLIEKDLSVEERLQHEKNKTKKSSKNKSASNTSFTIDMKSEPLFLGDNVEPGTYEEVDEKYGIVFCDMNLDSIQDLPNNLGSYYKSNGSDKLFTSKPNVYPLQLINKIVINPNQSSYLYFATGYQAGFVRISSLKFLNGKRS